MASSDRPSVAAAFVFAAFFTLSTALHLYQLIRTRTWFWIAFLIGGIFESFGFVARGLQGLAGPNDDVFTVVVISNIGIILAPIFFAASVYMMLGRIILVSGGREKSLISPRWLTKIFVVGDIVAFLIQAFGVTLLLKDNIEDIKRGQDIILIGLWVQIAFFVLFIFSAAIFWWRMSKSTTSTARSTAWVKALIVLLVASSLILLRCIFRVVEYMEGPKGHLMTNEIFMYILDAGPMMIMMMIFNVSHPSEIGSILNNTKVAVFLKVKTTTSKQEREVIEEEELVGVHNQRYERI